ncbi:MAG: hypothetical protein ABL973_15700 [Micropepsaceae bacterium]
MSEEKTVKTQSELKRERLAAALRENLKRRKTQARGQARALTAEADEANSGKPQK